MKFRVSAKQEKQEEKKKQSLFNSVTKALDFSQVRSAEDAQLIEEAREATRSGERMSREQARVSDREYQATFPHTASMIDLAAKMIREGRGLELMPMEVDPTAPNNCLLVSV
ncbi:hypothetical protein JHK86_000756 [Glycine max]|nr:hypothetical protein JHK86_000756 [Glycine max]